MAGSETQPFSTYPQLIQPRPMLQSPPPLQPQSSHSITSFPILALTILGILTASILLLTYYIFVIKCCLNWHRSDVTGLVERSRRRRSQPDVSSTVQTPATEAHGLDDLAIEALPAFRYRKVSDGETKNRFLSFHECAVCLNEFQEEEKIRLLPDCFHVFHVDCVDTWLEANSNCPLCRSAITTNCPIPLDQLLNHEELVLEVSEESSHHEMPQTIATSDAVTVSTPRKKEQVMIKIKNGMYRSSQIRSKGDECIDTMRCRDEQFLCNKPTRRSFSMDSLSDGHLYMTVPKVLQQNAHSQEAGHGEGSSNANTGKHRRLLSFGPHRGGCCSVLPL